MPFTIGDFRRFHALKYAVIYYDWYKNNTPNGVSIDYLGGNGGVKVDPNFIPKSGVANGFTVPAMTTATALFSSENEYYANATIQAAFYDAEGNPSMKSRYYMEYNHSEWTVTDQGSTKESSYCSSPDINQVFVCLTDPNIGKIEYAFASVASNSQQAIEDFQWKYETGLMPNVIHYDGTGYDQWSESFGFDACRFPLWAGLSLQKGNSDPKLLTSLQKLLHSLPSYIQQGTFPSLGIDAIKQTAIGSWGTLSPALNAPCLFAASVLKDQPILDALALSVFAYDITKNQPSSLDPMGDSSPYFNAVMVLLARAAFEQRL